MLHTNRKDIKPITITFGRKDFEQKGDWTRQNNSKKKLEHVFVPSLKTRQRH